MNEAVLWLEEQFEDAFATESWKARVTSHNKMVSLKEDHECPRTWCLWTGRRASDDR